MMTSGIPKTLTLTPIIPSNLLPREDLIKDGQSVLDASMLWKKGKTFGEVETFSYRAREGQEFVTWHCRVSEHRKEDITFEQLWGKLGKNKVVNEQRFKPKIREATQIQYISESESIWTIYYAYPPPFSPRIFTEYQVTQLNDFPPQRRTGIMVSVPVDLGSSEQMVALEEKGIKARHVRVERIEELDGGVIEWRMATCEDHGGMIPRSCQDRRMPEIIAKDVESFTSWFKGLPTKTRSKPDRDIDVGPRSNSWEHV